MAKWKTPDSLESASPTFHRVITAYCTHGNLVEAGKAVHKSSWTVDDYMVQLRRLMGTSNGVAACVKYTEWKVKEQMAQLRAERDKAHQIIEQLRCELFVTNRDLQQYQIYHQEHQAQRQNKETEL
jgi:hypothetical protein